MTVAGPIVGQSSEYALKAVYVLNLINFTEWPAEAFRTPADPLTVCVAEPDPFGPVLGQTLAGERVAGRAVAVVHVEATTSTADCHVLFVPAAVPPDRWLAAVAARPVLTVGESAAFASAGGMIRFVLENRRVRFDANGASARAAGLTLSARLLQVARSRTPEDQ
jgi:hypothetical protein